MTGIQWHKHATMYSGGITFATGSLARLAHLYLQDTSPGDRWRFFISGTDLPILHRADRANLMLGAGVEELAAAFQREQPPVEEPAHNHRWRDRIACALRLRPAAEMPHRQVRTG